MLDAALTGGIRGAEAGQIALLVGGEAAHLDAVLPAGLLDELLRATEGPAARILSTGFARVGKGEMPKAPVPAAQAALEDAGLSIADLDVIKTHNPFAVNDLWFARETGADADAMNPFGMEIAG